MIDLKKIDSTIKSGPFTDTWESLENYRVPQWYEDEKFGIFIHWGLYAVPAFGNEWYPRNMYQKGSREYQYHIETFGPHSTFGYKDFIPMFKAEKYDPRAWAKLFKQAGARFVVPVAEHHDGFAMYNTRLSRWCAAKMGPKRDLVGELAREVRDAGMIFGASSHRAEHWWFFDGGMQFDSDVKNPKFKDLYGPAAPKDTTMPDAAYLNDWLLRTCELVDLYQPQILWFDWWIENAPFKPYLRKVAAYYYNRAQQWGKTVAINYKNDAYTPGSAVLDLERGGLADIRPMLWQTDTAVSRNSWGYVRGQDYKTATSLIHDLVDIVSKNGALLLNIGPRADGTIPEEDIRILQEIGAWLKTHGQAIYNTRPWWSYGEGPTKITAGGFGEDKRQPFTHQDIRFTASGETLYAIALGWPADRKLSIKKLGTNWGLVQRKIQSVELLGSRSPVKWKQTAGALEVELPARKPNEHACVLKIGPVAPAPVLGK